MVSGSSEARYSVREQLAQSDLPNDAIGATNNVSGSIIVDRAGSVVSEQSRIVVDTASLESDAARRLRPGEYPGDTKLPDCGVRYPGSTRATEPAAGLRRGAVPGRGRPDRPRRDPSGYLGRHGVVRQNRGRGGGRHARRYLRLRHDPTQGRPGPGCRRRGRTRTRPSPRTQSRGQRGLKRRLREGARCERRLESSASTTIALAPRSNPARKLTLGGRSFFSGFARETSTPGRAIRRERSGARLCYHIGYPRCRWGKNERTPDLKLVAPDSCESREVAFGGG